MSLPATVFPLILGSLMRHWSNLFETVSLADNEHLAGAVDATDDWIEANQAGYNAALPAPARNNLSAAQKTLLFCAVALARVSITFLRRLFGEVN